jgi:acetyl-CoA carboxylase biotin carboxyl carrier protein
MDPLTNEDVADILALLDSLPYDEFDLETPRFRLTLRRTPGGWTQSTQILSASEPTATAASAGTEETGRAADEAEENGEAGAAPEGAAAEPGAAPEGPVDGDGRGTEDASGGAGGGEHEDAGLVAVRAPLPGTFYRAPRPGAAPFAEVGSRVGADTVIGIVETMKLMNSVPAGVAGVVAEFCVTNAELVAQGAALLRIRAEE